jgi:hypothetical protein
MTVAGKAQIHPQGREPEVGLRQPFKRRSQPLVEAAVLASLDAVADGDWALGANFYGHGFYTIEGLFHTPAQHLAEHTAALVGERATVNDRTVVPTRPTAAT